MKTFFKISILLSISTSAFSEVVWLKESKTRMSWDNAIKYCKDMNAVLPSKKIFHDIWIKNNKASDIDGFEMSVSYWTSDEVSGNEKHAAYPFYFGEGRDTWYYKADHYGVRCIKK